MCKSGNCIGAKFCRPPIASTAVGVIYRQHCQGCPVWPTFDYDDYAKAVGCDWLVFDEVTTKQQRWSCFVSDIQSNSGGAALSVTSNPTVVELLCQLLWVEQLCRWQPSFLCGSCCCTLKCLWNLLLIGPTSLHLNKPKLSLEKILFFF